MNKVLVGGDGLRNGIFVWRRGFLWFVCVEWLWREAEAVLEELVRTLYCLGWCSRDGSDSHHHAILSLDVSLETFFRRGCDDYLFTTQR